MITPTPEEISQLAYQLWQQGGHPEGRSDEFWLAAERQLKAGRAHPVASAPINPERLKAEAAAESVTDNYLSPATSQQTAIKAAIPPQAPISPAPPPPSKVVPAPKRRR